MGLFWGFLFHRSKSRGCAEGIEEESCAKSNGRRMQRLRSLSKGTENERSRRSRVGLRRWGNRQLYASAAVAFRGDRDFRRSEGNNWPGFCPTERPWCVRVGDDSWRKEKRASS